MYFIYIFILLTSLIFFFFFKKYFFHSEWCSQTKEKYNVQPMKSWGKLPMNMMDMWKDRNCDKIFTAMRMIKRPLSKCSILPANSSLSLSLSPNQAGSGTNAGSKTSGGGFGLFTSLLSGGGGGGGGGSGSGSAVASTSLSEEEKEAYFQTLPVISIMAAATTRRVVNPSPANMALFMYLLPSLIRTLDCGYRYEYVLGFDVGDPFYDSDEVSEGGRKGLNFN